MKEDKRTFCIDIAKTIKHYGHTYVAKYVANFSYQTQIYLNNNVYCYKYTKWEQSSNKLYFNFKNIINNFKIYNYLVDTINYCIDKITDIPFLNNAVTYIKRLIKTTTIIFDSLENF